MYGQWKQSGVKFVGTGLLDTKEACQTFVQRYRLSFPNGYDRDRDRTVAKQYGFTDQASWTGIDKVGRLLKAAFGPANEGKLVATVKNLTGR